jgi:dTMP kinase
VISTPKTIDFEGAPCLDAHPMHETSHRGRLVVVEGIDGAGKSSLIRHLAGFCERRGRKAVCSREPTAGPWGRKIRATATSGRLPLEEELALFIEDRREHVAQTIAPALARGEIVLLDRYYFSNAAYQGARGADPNAVVARNREFAPAPDLVLLLDLDPGTGRGRITGRGDVPDAFEDLQNLARVRQILLSLRDPTFLVLDATLPAGRVGALAEKALETLL